MSMESLSTLNTNTLIGHTDRRGRAWHYKSELQGERPNHYPGAIPVADVRERLFNWRAAARPVAVERPATEAEATHRDAAGNPARWVVDPRRRAIVREDDHEGTVFGVFSADYVPHQYGEWLLENVEHILDDDLSIASAGVLREGAVAWVEVSVPDALRTPEGVEFRPNLLATTTLDGTLATTYKRTVTDVVCDNTRNVALAERGPQAKFRHSRYEKLGLLSARQALEVVYTTADAFAAEVARLCAVPVSEAQWSGFLDVWVPATDPQSGDRLTGPRRAVVERRRSELDELYRTDERAAPWRGTAHAVVQAVNTHEHHKRALAPGANRLQSNMRKMVTGAFEELDLRAWRTLEGVLLGS
jgi:phage/plasmid-like protein (TIGR03299 family)